MLDFDMCVDYEELCEIEAKLKIIETNILESKTRLSDGVNRGQAYLSGRQYDKVKYTTDKCEKITLNIQKNIRNASSYLDELKHLVEEYSNCGYEMEG